MDPVSTAITVTLSLIGVIAVTINVLCIFIIVSSKLLWEKRSSIFIFSVLMLHMIQGFLVIPFYAAKKAGTSNSTSKTIICDGFRFTYMITFYGSCVNVLFITIDRLLAVILLTAYKQIVTRKRVIIAAVCLWIYVIMLCLIPFLPQKQSEKSTSTCSYNPQKEWTIFMLFANTVFPYVIVIVTYTYIFIMFYKKKVKRQTKKCNPINGDVNKSEVMNGFCARVSSQKNVNMSTLEMKRCKEMQKITKITFVVVLIYGITWAPTIIYYLLIHLNSSHSHHHSSSKGYTSFIIKFITFFDAIAAPIIYCYYHDDFKQEFNKLFRQRRSKVARETHLKALQGAEDYQHEKIYT